MSQVKSTTHHLIYGPVMAIYNWKYDRNSRRDCDPFHLLIRTAPYPHSYLSLFRLDDLPILSLTWHHPLIPSYDLAIPIRLSILQYHCLSFPFISLIWPGRVWDGLTWGELYTMIYGSWWESGLTTWRCCWGRGDVMEHPDLSHYTWLRVLWFD